MRLQQCINTSKATITVVGAGDQQRETINKMFLKTVHHSLTA